MKRLGKRKLRKIIKEEIKNILREARDPLKNFPSTMKDYMGSYVHLATKVRGGKEFEQKVDWDRMPRALRKWFFDTYGGAMTSPAESAEQFIQDVEDGKFDKFLK